MTAWQGVLFPQLPYIIQIMNEGFPLRGVLLDVFLGEFVVYHLRRVTVTQIIPGIALILANHRIMQDKFEENTAVDIGYVLDIEQDILSEMEFQLAFMIVLSQFLG